MSEAELAHIRAGVEDLRTSLALHDQRAILSVDAIKGTQDRIAVAIEEVAKATAAIQGYAERIEKRNGQATALRLSPQLVAMLVGGGIALGALFKGGGEAATLLLKAFGVK